MDSLPVSERDSGWRQAHAGHWLHLAGRKFETRVLGLMARNEQVPLALSNLAARGALTASHIHITRHLGLQGSRLVDLARSAGVSKQAMGKLVDQCAAWSLVERTPDPSDARACLVRFTDTGRAWLEAYAQAVQQAESELFSAVGTEVATVIKLGLEAYAA
jgi:DNA-binding MarR family transcriptional regulator